MKRILSTRLSLLFFAFLFAAGCRKETTKTTELNEEIAQSSMENRSDKGGDCRLTLYDYYTSIDDYHQVDYFSYNRGKVDEWLTSWGSLFKMEYDKNEKLKIARMYDGETLVNTIKFIYKNGKVVKEIWYDGNTNVVADEVTNTYNQKGEMIRNESISFDYYVTYTYTNEGNLKSWFYFFGGLPSQKAEYTYRSEFKNPYGARPGIEYSFPYANSSFGTGKNWYSSEKITLFDEGGNSSVYYDQDPRQTVWQRGPKNYPLMASYIDRISSGVITNTFEYENCSGHHNDSQAGSLSQKQTVNKSKAATANFKSLMHGPRGGILQKMKKQLIN
jgi:hypothetical protein